MNNQHTFRPMLQSFLGVALVVIAIALTIAGWYYWEPIAQQLGIVAAGSKEGDADHAEHAEHADHEETAILTLTPEARASLDVVIGPLERSNYERTLRVPGRVVPIAGVSLRDVTSQTSGNIKDVFVRSGQSVAPGQPLFTISLVHQEAVAYQLDLIDALASLEAVQAEITRLETVLATSPGGTAQRALIEQRYEFLRLEHLIESRRHALELLGVDPAEIDNLLLTHDPAELEATDPTQEPHDHAAELIPEITVHAPGTPPEAGTKGPMYTIQGLAVHPGEHVEVGQMLCQLGQYETLYIEGNAFEQDLAVLRNALELGWTVTAAWEIRDGVKEELRDLPILYLDPVIDQDSRAIHFFVELENTPSAPRDIAGRPYVDWRFRPGQRVELRVPVEKFEDSLVVPIEALAQDGLDFYVFQSSKPNFKRIPVVVLHRDQDYAVLADDGNLRENTSLAMSGAFQLQLALESKTRGAAGVDSGHGHAH